MSDIEGEASHGGETSSVGAKRGFHTGQVVKATKTTRLEDG